MARYNFIPETNDPEHLFTDIAQIGIVVRDLDTTANIYEHFDIDQLIDAIDAPVTNALLANQETGKKKKP